MSQKADTSTKYSRVEPTTKERPVQENNLVHQWSFQRHRSLIWMSLSWIGAIAFAVGHHFFYARFDGQRVDMSSISQLWIVRIGTGMAFLVKTLLVVSASIAFTQHQWLTTRSKPFKVRQIDTISSILGNALGFFGTRVWLRFPVLSLLAGITWLLPIAAIITPASITVVAHQELATTPSTPRQLYYDPNQYGSLQTLVRTDYVGPSTDTLRTAYGSAMTGQILPIPAAQPNMSYTLQFVGPALRCDPADASLIQEVYDAYIDQLTGIEDQYHYIAWVPTTGGRLNLTETSDGLDLVSTDAAHIYIIPNTSVAGPVYVGGIMVTPEDAHYGYQDLLDCRLYNASYQAFLNFSYPSQTIDIQSRDLLNPVNVSTDISDWYYETVNNADIVGGQAQRICYQAIMHSLGKLLVGYEWWRDGYIVTAETSWAMMSINWTARDTAQHGLEELFQNMTLSMLSSASLTMNSTIAAQNQILVDVYSNFNIYTYNPRDLWLAYGIAAGSALVCVVFGTYAMWRNGAGYQNVFSTFLRTAREQALQSLIDPTDNGAEPLPSDLAEASIILAEKRRFR